MSFDANPLSEPSLTASASDRSLTASDARVASATASDEGGAIQQMLLRLSRGVALLDAEGRVAECNPAFARLLGYASPDAAKSADLQRHVAGDDRAQYRRAIAKAMQSGAAAPQVVLLQPKGSDEGAWAKLVATRFSDQPGERRLVVELSSATDSRRRQADTLALQQKLYHAEQLTRELSERAKAEAQLALEHRLRVALTSLVGYAESLHDTSLSPAAREEAIHTIQRVTQELLASFDTPSAVLAGAPASLNAGASMETPRQAAINASAVVATTIATPSDDGTSGQVSASPTAFPIPTSLDLKPAEQAFVRRDPSDPLQGRKFRGKVLVVEDSKDNQRLLVFLLRKLGLQVETADNGLDAVDRYDTAVAQADLVLLDMQMPKLDGYQTAAAMRSRGYSRAIIALTADVREGSRERCLAAGCTEYLTKPVDRRHLVAALAAHLHAAQPDIELTPMSAYYDPQPSVPIPLPLRGAESIEERRKLQDELPGIASQLWTCATVTPVPPNVADAARRTLRDLAERGRNAGMGDIAALADEAETSIRLGADATVVHHALGRLLRTISRDDELEVIVPPPMPTFNVAA
jgi:CheY-like chemotaxis protein